MCWVGAVPSSLLKGISLLEKGDQRLRVGTAELKHLVIPGDDLQGPAFPAKPELPPVSEGNVDCHDAFNFSEGDLFFQDAESKPRLRVLSRYRDRQRIPETFEQNGPWQEKGGLQPVPRGNEEEGQACHEQRPEGEHP